MTFYHLWLLTVLLMGALLSPTIVFAAADSIDTSEPIPLSGQYYDPYGIVPDEASFVWKPEVEPAYQIKKEEARNHYTGPVNPQTDAEIYKDLYQPGLIPVDFSAWRAHWGPRPLVFQVKLDVSNWAFEVSEPSAVHIDVYALMGEKLVNQGTFLTNAQAMRASAKWIKLDSLQGTMPILAPEEHYTWYSEPIEFGKLLLTHPDYLPVEIKAVIAVKQTVNAQPVSRTIETNLLIDPNHFADIHF